MPDAVRLIKPEMDALPAYRAALERGWSPDNVGLEKTIARELAAIEADAAGFVAGLDDLQARGGPIAMPDGTLMERLPGYRRWLMDGEAFCGSFGFRWRPGTEALPPHVLGHVGYAVPEWKRGRGYATRGLALLLPGPRAIGLAYVELTTDPDNEASQKVILNNGGYLVERFTKLAAYGSAEALRWRINL
ncbi:MAG: GNAT family N-acetyltransferase [Caulobacteraceae bacterium]|nr:GNAT family N-acetyltransferase [Caulobacteraceae bacterium]